MAKKRVSVYMQEEDLDWLAQYPTAESVSGSAVLIMEWAMKMLRRGRLAALQKLSAREKEAIIGYSRTLIITSDYSQIMLSSALYDWFKYDEGTGLGWTDEEISKLIEKCQGMSPAEVVGLLAWARGYFTQGSGSINQYIESK